MKVMKISDARRNLAGVLDAAVGGEETIIPRADGRAAVIISVDEWDTLRAKTKAFPHVGPRTLISMIDETIGGEPQAVRVSLTVELAQQLLDRYTPARRALSERRVAEIAHRIEHRDPEGNSFEEICVAPDGKTLAGQHLLTAALRTGKTIDNVTVLLNRVRGF
jgi:prevent-host-death family protein